MRYTYTKFKRNEAGMLPTRIDITTRFEEIGIEDCSAPFFTEVWDNMNSKAACLLETPDDHLGWSEKLQRDETWKSKEERKPYNALEETDGFHVADNLVKAGIAVSAAELVNLVDTNLKTAAAAGKPVISPIPPIALLALGAAMNDGCKKYGRFNWRETGATSSVFYDAMHRHLAAWYSGENYAPDSKIHHLAHLMSSCAILLDAELHNILNDDRDLKGTVVDIKAIENLIKQGV